MKYKHKSMVSCGSIHYGIYVTQKEKHKEGMLLPDPIVPFLETIKHVHNTDKLIYQRGSYIHLKYASSRNREASRSFQSNLHLHCFNDIHIPYSSIPTAYMDQTQRCLSNYMFQLKCNYKCKKKIFE